MSDSILIVNGTLIRWTEPNEMVEDGAVYIEGGVIRDVGGTRELEERHPDADRLDADGRLVMPGNICAHTHFYGALARGMAIPGSPPDAFPEILRKLWWPLDKALGPEDVRISALLCLVDAIRHGTTTLFDHHASPNAIDGSLDVIADAVEEAGLRACLCYEVTDRDGPGKTHAGIAENERFIKAARDRDLISAMFGLHASLTLSDETLAACAAAAEGLGTGFHIHLAEHEVDEYDSIAKSGLRTAHRLDKFGILGPKTIAAHAVHVDAWEMLALRDTGTWVTHQPRSNMNNGVGTAPVEEMLRGGIRVGLGNDGFSNNMWAEWKAAYLVHKLAHRDPRRASGVDVAKMAVYNNADLAAMYFPDSPPGKIIPGAAGDLILVDYYPPTPMTPDNLPWHIIFGFEADMVNTTVVAGKVLMRDRELLTLDEVEIAARARELAPKVWERYEANVMT